MLNGRIANHSGTVNVKTVFFNCKFDHKSSGNFTTARNIHLCVVAINCLAMPSLHLQVAIIDLSLCIAIRLND